jgi:hypothetical protein
MPYIGKSPVSGGFHKLDALTASATATYALTLGSAAYFPETANQLLVSLNGVIQAPQDSFTVSGSNLIFDTALTASDSIDFVVALGDVLGVQGVTDGAVTTAKLGNSAVTDAKIDTMAASKLTGTINSGRFPSGSIIQTQYTQIDATSQWTCNSNTDKEISVLAVNITPVSTNSIIKIEAMVNGEWGAQGSIFNAAWFFYRDSTKLAAPVAGNRNSAILMGTALTYQSSDTSSTPEHANYSYFDTPSTTSQITYKVGVRQSENSATDWYLNRCVADTDLKDQERGVSLICVTEIAG